MNHNQTTDSQAVDGNFSQLCEGASVDLTRPIATTSKRAFDLAKAYRWKSVIVHNTDTNNREIMDLMQLIPGVPIIGLRLKNGSPKNWCSTPVVCIRSDVQGSLSRTDGDEIVVVTTSNSYIIKPVYSGVNIQDGVVLDEQIYCGLSPKISEEQVAWIAKMLSGSCHPEST